MRVGCGGEELTRGLESLVALESEVSGAAEPRFCFLKSVRLKLRERSRVWRRLSE